MKRFSVLNPHFLRKKCTHRIKEFSCQFFLFTFGFFIMNAFYSKRHFKSVFISLWGKRYVVKLSKLTARNSNKKIRDLTMKNLTISRKKIPVIYKKSDHLKFPHRYSVFRSFIGKIDNAKCNSLLPFGFGRNSVFLDCSSRKMGLVKNESYI